MRSFFYATSTCTNARASNPNEGMLSHIPSKVHTKDDNIMNVPELFSTISRLKAFARPLHARTENRIPVRSSRPPSRKTQSSFVKNEDGFIKESALLFKKTSSSFFRARSKSSTICLSPSFPQSSSVRRWCKKRDRTRCCCSAHREHNTVSSRDVYCYARIYIYIYI